MSLSTFLLGMFVLALTMCSLYPFTRRRPQRHRHLMVAVSAKVIDTYPREGGKLPVLRETNVLHVCVCGRSKVETLEGHWTLAELRGQSW